jgi:hypothetical protein
MHVNKGDGPAVAGEPAGRTRSVKSEQSEATRAALIATARAMFAQRG